MKLGVPHRHLYPSGVQAGLSEPGGHGVRQYSDPPSDLLRRGEVLGEGGAITHRFDWLRLVPGADRVRVQPVGIVVKLGAQLAHQGHQSFSTAGGQVPDGLNAKLA